MVDAIIQVAVVVLGFTLEQGEHVVHAELAHCLAALERRGGELALCLLQVQDALFDAVVDGEAVDGYVDGLVEAVDAVDGLFFYELFLLVLARVFNTGGLG